MNDDEDDDESFAEYMKEMIENDESEEKEPETTLNQIKDALGVTKKEDMYNMEPRWAASVHCLPDRKREDMDRSSSRSSW